MTRKTAPLTATDSLLLGTYATAWRAALPALALNKRLRDGWSERRVPPGWSDQRDVWVQAASGGEAYLAGELFKAAATVRTGQTPQPCSFLATSCTRQGMEILALGAQWCRENAPHVDVRCAYFPFDAPGWMGRALDMAKPRAVVLLETEIWPGLLAAAAKRTIPVMVANGRMNARSLAGYLAMRPFLRRVAPARVLAISDSDAARFDLLFGRNTSETMPNMKFDRFAGAKEIPFDDNPLTSVVAPGTSFLVLGSVREEEEPQVRAVVRDLLAERPKTVIGLFPRHMHRLAAWKGHLKAVGAHYVRRSRVKGPVKPGSVVLWDTFGELNAAYALARAAFVGGSLKPLGGQNFLEPLAQGVVPFIGPHWSNFAWVGRDIVDRGLVKEVASADELTTELLKVLKRPASPAKIKAQAEDYIASHTGGANKAWEALAKLLGHGETGKNLDGNAA